MADEHNPNAGYSEVFEEGKDEPKGQNIHRIRANSSIMQLKKILGECSRIPQQSSIEKSALGIWDLC